MNYYAVISKMEDAEKNKKFREAHLDYLEKLGKEGKIFAKGRFTDETGGLVIYQAESIDEVKAYVDKDPFIVEGARSYEVHEWAMKRIA